LIIYREDAKPTKKNYKNLGALGAFRLRFISASSSAIATAEALTVQKAIAININKISVHQRSIQLRSMKRLNGKIR